MMRCRAPSRIRSSSRRDHYGSTAVSRTRKIALVAAVSSATLAHSTHSVSARHHSKRPQGPRGATMDALFATSRRRLSTIDALAFALACPAGLISAADLTASRGVEPSGGTTYDALLSEPGNMCGPSVAG